MKIVSIEEGKNIEEEAIKSSKLGIYKRILAFDYPHRIFFDFNKRNNSRIVLFPV